MKIKNKLSSIFILILFSSFFGLDQILETFNNGSPKIVRTYSSYSNKLALTKEIGYYVNGQIEYEKKYRNGELVVTNKWNQNGKKEKLNLIPNKSINSHLKGWPSEQVSQMRQECVGDGNSLKECECAIEKFQNEYTWDEWQSNVESGSSSEENMQRMMNVVIQILTDCGISF